VAALKSILSSRMSKWMGHTIATIFLPRSYCQTYSGYPRLGFCHLTWRRTGASRTSIPSLSWSERCPTSFIRWIHRIWTQLTIAPRVYYRWKFTIPE